MKKKILFIFAFALGIQFVSAQAIDDSQVVMYLDFEGDLVDAKGNFTFAKNTGSLTGDATYSSTNGKYGQYGVFSNTSYISGSQSVYNCSNSASISVWVRLDATANITALTNVNTILDMANNGGGANDGQTQLRFRKNIVSTTITAALNESSTQVVKESWYHLTSVIDVTDTSVDLGIDATETVANRANGSQKVYINGVLEFYDRKISPRNVQNELIIGSQKAGNGQNIIGDLDDLLISTEAFSAEQVKSVMNLGVEAARTSATTSVWNGTTSDWDVSTNWTPNGVPSVANDVVIPDGTANDPIASGAISVRNMIIQENASLNVAGVVTSTSINVYDGASFIAGNTVSGTLAYNIITTDPTGNPLEWHLLSAPVSGETYDDNWIADNFIGTGNLANRGVALYDNTTDADGDWTYYQAGTAALPFNLGIGFTSRKTSVNSNADEEQYSFIGVYPDADVTTTITQSASNWNLSGNPFPSYLRVSELVANNTASLSGAFQTVYIWNPITEVYASLVGTDYVAPGQGFFVNAANSTSGNFVFAETLQSHQSGITFYKSADTKIALSISDETKTRTASINYASDKTLGLDAGNDIGMFTGLSSGFSVYTHLVGNDEGIAFERQALPNSDFESMVIPVGVIANAGKEISFSVDAQNLPSGINVYLEDKVAKTFTLLENGTNHTITLNEKQEGIGRFYLHTRSAALSTDDVLLDAVRIFKTNNATVRISGLNNGEANFTMFSILGKQVLNTSFTANGNKDISLPNLATGIYLIKLETENGNISKKIILE